MRQELLAVAYDLLPYCGGVFTEAHLYYGTEQMLGQQAAGNPIAGWRQRLGRDLAQSEWSRIYDVICWMWQRFQDVGVQELFRQNINHVLAAYGVVWEIGQDGNMHRILPIAAQAQVVAALAELGDARYAPARALFVAAKGAYDDRPRRDRDACSNVFDGLESVAKITFNRPDDTFGRVKNHIEQNNLLRPEIVGAFTALNQMRNSHFGHGMVVHFNLSDAEVDFVYLTCIASILLLTRTP